MTHALRTAASPAPSSLWPAQTAGPPHVALPSTDAVRAGRHPDITKRELHEGDMVL